METKANYVIIGASTLAVAILAILFGLWAAKFTADTAWNHYVVRFTDSVIGLSRGSPVLYNGVHVGRVNELRLDPKDVRNVIAEIQVEATVPIHEDTVATIRLTGLTGTAAVQLRGGTPGSPLLEPDEDDPPRIPAEASPLTTLLEQSEGIVVTANRVVSQLDALLSDENIQHVNATLASVEQFTTGITETDADMARLLANAAEASEALPELVERLNGTTERLDRVLATIDRAVVEQLPGMGEKLNATLANVESLSGRIDAIIDSNQAALSQIGGVGMREVSGGLEDLRRLVRDLSAVVSQIERNPSEFLFGGEQPEEYKP